jgi:hypothetical protein
MRRRLSCGIFGLVLVLAGCANVTKVDSGTRQVGARLSLNIDGAWNHLDFAPVKPAEVWTMEGVYVDELLIYSGVKDGERMHPSGSSDGNKKDVVPPQ